MAYILRLLLLILLSTISNTASFMESSTPNVQVKKSNFPQEFSLTGCTSTVNVQFNEITLKGKNSNVLTYARTPVTLDQIYFAVNSTIVLDGAYFVQCAKAAVAQGVHAFMYNGSCIGYSMDKKFLRCSEGEIILYVTVDYFDNEPVSAKYDDEPYKLVDFGIGEPFRLYMMDPSGFDVPASYYGGFGLSEYMPPMSKTMAATLNQYSYIYLNDGDKAVSIIALGLNVDSCSLNAGAYGYALWLAQPLYDGTRNIFHFFNECGKTIVVSTFIHEYETFHVIGANTVVYSHEGVGCKTYPADAFGECAVTFKADGDYFLKMYHEILMEFTENGCAGFEIEMACFNSSTNETMVVDFCTTRFLCISSDTITLKVLKHPSLPSYGFYFAFNSVESVF